MKKNANEILTHIFQMLNNSPLDKQQHDLNGQAKELKRCLMINHNLGSVDASLFAQKVVNLFLSRIHMEHRHAVLTSKPFSLVVDPCGACNLRCPGCIHISPHKDVFSWPNAMLSKEKYHRFIDTFGPSATHISFYHSGEPLLNPLTPEFIQTAKKYRLATVMSTNLCVQTVDLEHLVNSGLDYMIVCIDGASQPVYEVYRKRGDFDLVMSNLQRLISAKRRLKSYSPYIVWQFLVFEHNSHEIDQAEYMAEKVGVNEFAAVKPYPVDNIDPSIKVAENADFRRATFFYDFDLAKQALDNTHSGLKTEPYVVPFPQKALPNPLKTSVSTPSSEICQWVYKSISMDAAGRILPCCRPPFKTDDLVFSDIMNGHAPYNSKKYQLVRRFFAHRESIDQCIELLSDTNIPFCFICRDRNISLQNTRNVRDYLKTSSLFNAISGDVIELLTDW